MVERRHLLLSGILPTVWATQSSKSAISWHLQRAQPARVEQHIEIGSHKARNCYPAYA